MHVRVRYVALRLFVFCAIATFGLFVYTARASAATITVSSADDLAADDGVCTLREAITAANSDAVSGASGGECAAGSGADIINFVITTGGTPFTNQTQTGYTISLGTVLPSLTTTMTLNGYTQPGSQANTNPAPEPLNGRLLVEVEGSSIVADTYAFDMQADNIAVRGLIVSGFDLSGAFGIGSNNLEVQGNYIGTNYQGTAAATAPLGFGVARSGVSSVSGLLIGGLDPEDRNLFGGMLESAITPNINSHNWTIQGNYIGVDVTGLNAIPNVTASTAGSLSLDNSNDHVVGGSEPTAINIISGNHGKGIAPNGTNNTRIEGNYIGVGRDGVTPLGNQAGGISYSGGNNDILIKDNIISHNADVGIYLADDPLSAVVQGNTIMHNYYQGILIADASLILIGGDTAQERNVISDNNLAGLSNMANISLVGLGATVSNVGIRGNYIGVNENGAIDRSFNTSTLGIGVALMVEDIMIGGDQPGEGNTIAAHAGPGIKVQEGYAPNAGPLTLTPSNISILGNSIYDSSVGSLDGVGTSGLGIDLYRLVVDNSLNPDSVVSDGPTLNDTSDTDTGPNNYMNFPVINSAIQNSTALIINFDLDAADSTNDTYRVEFFANDITDPSGYGEGQTYLGATTVANGAAQEARLTLAGGTDLTGKSITATTTAINNTTTTGYGATSEFSEAMAALVITPATAPTNNLASTGTNVWLYGVGIVSLVGVGGFLGMRRLRI